MATTYTANYGLGMQTDHGDTFDMKVITDNMQIIDSQLKANADASIPQAASSKIDNTLLATVYSGTLTGVIDAAITGDNDMYGVVRAYTVNAELEAYMQICELWNGTRLVRHHLNGSWSSWT